MENQSIAIERWTSFGSAIGDLDQIAHDIVASRPDIMVAGGGAPYAQALIRATSTIPIVFGSQDPVGFGLVTNLAHPGRNVTGSASTGSAEVVGKQLQLLTQAVPGLLSVAYCQPAIEAEPYLPHLIGSAQALGVTPIPVTWDELTTDDSYVNAFAGMASLKPGAVIVGQNAGLSARTALIAKLSLAARLPSIASVVGYPQAGGLMSYGGNVPESFARMASYVVRILNGAKPGDLPVEQPSVFDLVLNAGTARSLGLTLPFALTAQATSIIQ